MAVILLDLARRRLAPTDPLAIERCREVAELPDELRARVRVARGIEPDPDPEGTPGIGGGG
jgi:hypothetical protein